MKQMVGMGPSGDLRAAAGNIRNPDLVLMFANDGKLEKHAEELETFFPGVPSIGCIAMAYDTKTVEKGVVLVGFSGVKANANVLEHVSTMPARQIYRMEDDIRSIAPGNGDTAVIDFCTGNDALALSTVHNLLKKKHIQLMGGTGDGGKVSVNGKVYEDAYAYACVKNQGGKVRVYKENIYQPKDDSRLVASRTDKKKYFMGELNGRSAKQVYMDKLGIRESDITKQTFQNPLGKLIGEDIRIISIKEVSGNGLACYRQVNDSDVLTLLELRDLDETFQETTNRIRQDFRKISGIFSVNCLFRYLLFTDKGIWNNYLKTMAALGNHCGFIGYGEHLNDQFVNQTMTCVVFE